MKALALGSPSPARLRHGRRCGAEGVDARTVAVVKTAAILSIHAPGMPRIDDASSTCSAEQHDSSGGARPRTVRIDRVVRIEKPRAANERGRALASARGWVCWEPSVQAPTHPFAASATTSTRRCHGLRRGFDAPSTLCWTLHQRDGRACSRCRSMGAGSPRRRCHRAHGEERARHAERLRRNDSVRKLSAAGSRVHSRRRWWKLMNASTIS